MQASASGIITVRFTVQTAVDERKEMVLSPPAFKKKRKKERKSTPLLFSETWTGPSVAAGMFN